MVQLFDVRGRPHAMNTKWIWTAAMTCMAMIAFGQDIHPLEIKANGQSRESQVGEWLDQLHAERHHAGAVVVLKDGEVWAQWFHGVERKGGAPVNSESMFRLASVSKQFTVAGVLTAAAEGRLELDDDIRAFLLECPYEGVTVRHLMQHVSGIPDFYMDLPIPERGFMGIADVAQAMPNAPRMKREVGEDFAYSNTGYVLLAAILERVYDQSFEALMMEHVFVPAGLNCTRVWNLFSEDKDWPRKTWSMTDAGPDSEQMEPTELDGVAGDGGVFMCAEDVSLWNAWWTSNQTVSDSLRVQAFLPCVLLSGETSDYGFGWTLPDADHVAHSGAWLGARTLWWRSLDGQNAVVVFNHTRSDHSVAVGQEIHKALMGQ